jgi:acyl-CoA synthetase (AMP-forming)/AMP-acid ligase II
MGGTSRISREVYVRFCERLGVRLPGPTRRWETGRRLGVSTRAHPRLYRYQRTQRIITSPGNWRPLNGLDGVIGMDFYPTRLQPRLRNGTAQYLADYMLQEQILFLEELPKGPTGKVQRRALREMLREFADPQQAADHR